MRPQRRALRRGRVHCAEPASRGSQPAVSPGCSGRLRQRWLCHHRDAVVKEDSMASVDFRTRTDADIQAVDPVTFFEHDLPELIERNAKLAVPGAIDLSPKPFALEVDGRVWTLSLTDDALT